MNPIHKDLYRQDKTNTPVPPLALQGDWEIVPCEVSPKQLTTFQRDIKRLASVYSKVHGDTYNALYYSPTAVFG